jgi:ketosteroid isomerase-like protein
MSRQTVLAYFRAVDAHDIPGLLAAFHPSIVYVRPGYEPLIGLERLRRFYEEERVLATGGHILEHLVIDGDAGAAEGRYVGTKKDGSPVDIRWADFYTFEDGLIRTRRSYFFLPGV